MGTNTARNTVGYAGAGAAIGSAFTPVGTAIGAGIGAVVGGIVGFFQDGSEQARIDQEQAVLAAKRKNSNLQYKAALSQQEERYQGDDNDQLSGLVANLKDKNLTLDQKLSLIDTQINVGFGTESMKIVRQMQMAALAENDLNVRLDLFKASVSDAQIGRGQGISANVNTSAALGISGQAVDSQQNTIAHNVNKQIEYQLMQNGYTDVRGQTNDASVANLSAFDQLVQQSLSGSNTNVMRMDSQIASIGDDVTGLFNADNAFRTNARLQNQAMAIDYDSMQWNITQQQNLKNNWGIGLLTGVGDAFSNASGWYNAGKGAAGLWGSMFGTKQTARGSGGGTWTYGT